jgi:DNA (cytosine-5)-methyltransferase 1
MNDLEISKRALKIDKPIRLVELFAGIGAQAKSLKNIGADFEHYRVCELDKYAVATYNAIHNTNFETSDITQITAKDLGIFDTDKYCYIMTYSFPCQDLSQGGVGKGMAKGSGTRSGLLWEVERLLNECTELPQILLLENVTQIHSQKNKEHFDKWISFLESKGYGNYWQDLNAKSYGNIPQNRNRTFMVSVLGNYTYEFPKEIPLELSIEDMLEEKWNNEECQTQNKYKEYTNFYVTPRGSDGKLINGSYNRVWKAEKYCGALNLTKKQVIGKVENNILYQRELTPKETFLLMGFDATDYEKAARVSSVSNLYKQSGNSIVVNVLEKIFLQMGIEREV